MKTAMQELIDFMDKDVEMKMMQSKARDRLKWYIETYFLPKEREQMVMFYVEREKEYDEDAWSEEMIKINKEKAEQYFNQTFKQ